MPRRKHRRADRISSIAGQMQDELAGMRGGAMLEQVDTLPLPEQQGAALDRYGEMRLCQRRADVGRHVVGAFGVVHVEIAALRRQLAEEGLEIRAHVRIGVLLDEK